MNQLVEELVTQASKPGYRTTEFWRGIILKVLAVAAVVFHKDLTGTATWVPTAATIVAGLETALYSYGRMSVKKTAAQQTSPVTTSVSTEVTTGLDGEGTGI